MDEYTPILKITGKVNLEAFLSPSLFELAKIAVPKDLSDLTKEELRKLFQIYFYEYGDTELLYNVKEKDLEIVENRPLSPEEQKEW